MKSALGPYAFLPDQLEFTLFGDRAILAAAKEIPEAPYYAPQPISHGSLHQLLVHAMGSQWVWLNRFLGTSLPRIPDQTDYPTREALAKRWPEVHHELHSFVTAQTLTSLETPVTYRNLKGESNTCPLGQLLMHVTDHGTYHRGQQNTLLKLAGGKPINLFYYQWRIDHPL